MNESTKPRSAGERSPEKLLTVFSRGNIVLWMVVAIALHVALIGGTSVGYIRDTWIDPEGAAQRKAQAEAVTKAAAEKIAKGKAAAEKKAGTNTTATVTGTMTTAARTTPPAVPTAEPSAPATNADTVVIKRITDAAKPNELPSLDGLGISIEDTRK